MWINCIESLAQFRWMKRNLIRIFGSHFRVFHILHTILQLPRDGNMFKNYGRNFLVSAKVVSNGVLNFFWFLLWTRVYNNGGNFEQSHENKFRHHAFRNFLRYISWIWFLSFIGKRSPFVTFCVPCISLSEMGRKARDLRSHFWVACQWTSLLDVR